MADLREFWLVDDNEIDRVVNGRLVEAAFGGAVRKFKDGPTFLEALAAEAGVEENDLKPGSALEHAGVVVLLDMRLLSRVAHASPAHPGRTHTPAPCLTPLLPPHRPTLATHPHVGTSARSFQA